MRELSTGDILPTIFLSSHACELMMGKKKIRLWPEGEIEVGELLRAMTTDGRRSWAEGAGSHATIDTPSVSIKNCGNYGVFGF